MEKPNVKQIALNLVENTVMSTVNDVVRPYAEWYAAEKGGTIGAAILPFIDNLTDYLNKEVVDKINGIDDIT